MAEMADFVIERAESLGDVPHGFFGHGGPANPGAHQFGYGGLGDEETVRQNRAGAANAIIAGAVPITPHQVHSPDVITVNEPWDDAAKGRPIADAVVTKLQGVALGIVTADCAPVLFADEAAGVVGAAHAGWRGAQGGVLENTLAAMEALGATRVNIAAAIGPTIAQPSYEVDAPFRAHFTPEDERHFAPAPPRDGIARWHFDLPGYIARQLALAGVEREVSKSRDTLSHSERYHSYRRSSRRGEPDYGRQISLIALG